MSASAPLRAAAAGLLLGALAQYLFVREQLGLNLVVAAVACALLALRAQPRRLGRRDAALVGAVAFAAFAAVRAEPAVVTFDTAAALALLMAWLIPLEEMPRSLVARAMPTFAAALPAARERLPRSERPLRYAAGAALAVPFVVVFAALFASADAIFDRSLRDLRDLEWLREITRDLPARVVVAAIVGWAATGVYAWSGPRSVRALAVRTRLSSETAVAMLVAIDVIFALFVGLQIAYLFGGRDTLDAAGVTYSAYARRGFFELVAAASLVGALLFALGLLAASGRAFAATALSLIVLTAIVLASAAYRMSLYQQAYGWSELRLYANALIALLAVTLAVLALAVVTGRLDRVPARFIAAAAVVALVVNVIGPGATVAAANLDRFIDPSDLPNDAYRGLDIPYLVSIGDAAVPVMVDRAPALPPFFREALQKELRRSLAGRGPSGGWQSWNWDRARASEVLSGG